mmetsp:Transcript_5679/g.16062  ORF Transcript_5679/g.16062 Transcript_5679/m.16062 type:complete len:91 (-) Transcript_5679:240-512(-)
MCCGERCCQFLVSAICAYFVPPLGIYWRFGCGLEFWICVLLTCLGYIPGVVYAACMIGCEAPPSRSRVAEGRAPLGAPLVVSRGPPPGGS